MRQVALITGASSGIGKEFAIEFANHGFDLVVVARSKDKLTVLKEEIEKNYHVTVLMIVQDLFEDDAVLNIFKQVKEKQVSIDILVNNAGFGDFNGFLDSDLVRQNQMVRLNVEVIMQMVYMFGNEMKQRGYGKILNVSSAVGLTAGAYMSVYYATKAFVLSFSQAIAEELKGSGITVTVICPGQTNTDFIKKGHMEDANLFKIFKNARASDVAKLGYKATMQGKVVVNHGYPSHLLNIGTHILPKSILRKIMKIINGKPKKYNRKKS